MLSTVFAGGNVYAGKTHCATHVNTNFFSAITLHTVLKHYSALLQVEENQPNSLH